MTTSVTYTALLDVKRSTAEHLALGEFALDVQEESVQRRCHVVECGIEAHIDHDRLLRRKAPG